MGSPGTEAGLRPKGQAGNGVLWGGCYACRVLLAAVPEQGVKD